METTLTLLKLQTEGYFVWKNSLYRVVTATNNYVTVEDCKTLEQALIGITAFNRMEIEEVTHVAVCSS